MKSAEQIRAAADAVQEEYKGKEAKLYRSDGQKRYSEAEHAEQLRTLRQERNRKLDALGEEANAAMLAGNLKQGARTAAGAWEARLSGRRAG